MLPVGLRLPETKTMISSAASMAAAAMLLRSLARDYVPPEIRRFAAAKLGAFLASFSSDLTLVINEFDGLNRNHLFTAAEAYLVNYKALSSSSSSATTFRASMRPKDRAVSVSFDGNESIVDSFEGVTLTWRMIRKRIPSTYAPNPSDRFNNPKMHAEIRHLELRFHKKHRTTVLDRYLKYVIEESKSIREETKSLKLFTLKDDRIRPRRPGDAWQSVDLDHPATFDTVVMETPEVRRAVMEDLERFVKRKELYRKVGKAWKRGYLLFGPPGTGKSSLVAAMANFLKFDVYDLELTDLRSNSDLRRLLIATANRSILVVEDIDCSIELQNRMKKVEVMSAYHHPRSTRSPGTQVTLSGLLNFVDGLWSSCGDERIIVFTTNHKDLLDPALLRPGRMDVHIHMSYCSPCGFRLLASNYLGIEGHHPLYSEIEPLLLGAAKVTPAEVGEQLMKNEEPEIALRGLVQFLEEKIAAANETEGARIAEGEKQSPARIGHL